MHYKFSIYCEFVIVIDLVYIQHETDKSYIANAGKLLHLFSRTYIWALQSAIFWQICDLPEVINCQFLEFAEAPSGPMHFLLADQQFGIHCLNICAIQLLTPNNLGGTWRRSPDIQSIAH